MSVVEFKTKGQKALDEFVKSFNEGSVKESVILLTDGKGEAYFLPLGETPTFASLELLCLRALHTMLHLEDEVDEED